MVAGIDACGGGWVVVLTEGTSPLRLVRARVYKTFDEAASDATTASAIGVDIPIGLMDRGFRQCDLLAREMMGRYKNKVFKTSPRQAIHSETVAERHRLHRELTGEGLSPMAAAFTRKVAEVDDWMIANGNPQNHVFEVHPELCFRALNHGKPLAESKHSADGLGVRYDLLQRFFKGQDIAAWVLEFIRDKPRSQVKEDDLVDAVVACVTAATWEPEATIPGPEPPRDLEGLRMEMKNPKFRDIQLKQVVSQSPCQVRRAQTLRPGARRRPHSAAVRLRRPNDRQR